MFGIVGVSTGINESWKSRCVENEKRHRDRYVLGKEKCASEVLMKYRKNCSYFSLGHKTRVKDESILVATKILADRCDVDGIQSARNCIKIAY